MVLISLLLFLMLLVLMPVMFADLMVSALIKLKLQPSTALILVLAIMLGGLINILVKRLTRADTVLDHPLAGFRVEGYSARVASDHSRNHHRSQCWRMHDSSGTGHLRNHSSPEGIRGGGSFSSSDCCPAEHRSFFLATPVPKVGIVMPGLVPAVVAALSSLMFLPQLAPPVAFAAGVIGPLVGADLMHVRQFAGITIGIASIDGAGTFDGIVFSAILAAYLA